MNKLEQTSKQDFTPYYNDVAYSANTQKDKICPEIKGEYGIAEFLGGVYDEKRKDINENQIWSMMPYYLGRDPIQSKHAEFYGSGANMSDFEVKPSYKHKLDDRHIIYLMDHVDIPEWIVKTEHDFTMQRFGGVSINAQNYLSPGELKLSEEQVDMVIKMKELLVALTEKGRLDEPDDDTFLEDIQGGF